MIQTVTGSVSHVEFGKAAAHEHILVDFHNPAEPPRLYNRAEVITKVRPYLELLRQAGCQGFVDCTPAWLGRDPLVLRELSQQTGLKIVTNTGWYQEPMLPPEAERLTDRQIAALWIAEARDGIEGTGIRPGFIKIALNSGKLSDMARKILRAALLTSQATGLAIVSHTVGGEAMLEALAMMQDQKFDRTRFIWAHADAGDGRDFHDRAASGGLWLSLDGIGQRHEEHAAMLDHLIRDGWADQVLISQDSGWYQVGEPYGGSVRPYHTLFTEFIPTAVQWGISAAMLDKIISANVARALQVRD